MIIQNDKELKILREAGKKLAEILYDIEKYIKPGTTSFDVENYSRELMEKHGVRPATLGYKPSFSKKPYPAAICFSANDIIVHGIPNEKKIILKEGDIVSIDIVIEYKGFFVDSATTVGVGSISDKDKNLIEINRKTRDDAISIVKSGIRVGEIGKLVDNYSKKYGYKLPKELGGHGIGKSIHERPFIGNYDGAPDSDYILSEGEVITIEPMMSAGSAKLKLLDDGYSYAVEDGSNTSHFEHTLIVWNDGAEVLTVL